MRTAKAGEQLAAKAAAAMRKAFPMMAALLTTKDATTIHPKTESQGGQWWCADCGKPFANNMQAQGHAGSHRLAWWTGERFEEP